jgi:hypothetical protein
MRLKSAAASAFIFASSTKSQSPPWFAADEDVLCRRQVVHQVEFLMDDADAEGLCGLGSGMVTCLPSTQISPESG